MGRLRFRSSEWRGEPLPPVVHSYRRAEAPVVGRGLGVGLGRGVALGVPLGVAVGVAVIQSVY
jgi:hypothetical protein